MFTLSPVGEKIFMETGLIQGGIDHLPVGSSLAGESFALAIPKPQLIFRERVKERRVDAYVGNLALKPTHANWLNPFKGNQFDGSGMLFASGDQDFLSGEGALDQFGNCSFASFTVYSIGAFPEAS